MGAIGRGHRVHWLLSGRPTGTAHGALQFAGHLVGGSETAGGAERRRQASAARAPTAAQPIVRMHTARAHARTLNPLPSLLSLPLFPSSPPPNPPSLQHGAAKTEREGTEGRGRKISCCYGDDRQRRSRAVCWAGVEEGGRGAQCQLGNDLLRRRRLHLQVVRK